MPIAALIALQSTVVAIKQGCQMLAEGRAEIGKLKKTVEQGVGDAKTIFKEVSGLWAWIKQLFNIAPKPTAISPVKKPEPETTQPVKKAKEAPRELSFEEYQTQAIHQVCEQLKTFFEIQRKLKDYCRELEEKSATDPNIEANSIDRVNIELQLENMAVQIRETMVYAPMELKDIYSRFLKMYDQILEEQAFAREVKKKTDRDEKWRRQLLREHRIDKGITLFTVLLAGLWMWAMMLSLGWLVRTPGGMSSLLSY